MPQAFTREQRETALRRLARLGDRQEFTKLRAVAETEFWGEWLDHRSGDFLRRVMARDESHLAFREWFQVDHRLPGGSTLVQLLLDREGDELPTGEQRYLERLRVSHVRAYAVAAIRLDEGLDLLDLWTRRTTQVEDRSATRQLGQGDVLVARVVLDEHGVSVIDGYPYRFPASERESVLMRLTRAYRAFSREAPRADVDAFFKDVAPVLFRLWVDRVALRPPGMVTAEGAEVQRHSAPRRTSRPRPAGARGARSRGPRPRGPR